jgi:hypothetical protein
MSPEPAVPSAPEPAVPPPTPGARARSLLKTALPAAVTPLFALGLLLASTGGRVLLAVALLVVQLILVVSWFRGARLTTLGLASGALAPIAAAISADVVLLRVHDRSNVRGLAGVLAGLVIAAFLVQLARRDGRVRLTGALAASMATGALAVTAAVLLAVRGGPHGTTVFAVALTAVAVGVLPIAIGVLPTGSALPLWASMPGGLGLGAGVGALIAAQVAAFGAGTGAIVGLVAATLAIGVKAALSKVPEGVPIWGVAATLPIVVVAPAVFIVARIMVG